MSGDGLNGEPLCPRLYQLLQKRFRRVEIANAGMAMQARRRERKSLEGRWWDIHDAGEYYRVNCPFCTDTRQRLWINHRYGRKDEYDPKGRVVIWLAHCYNENCLQSYERQVQLEDMVLGFINANQRNTVLQVSKGEDRAKLSVCEPLGDLVRIHKLDPRHAAVRYLADRGFDIEDLGRTYKVDYCFGVNKSEHRAAVGRIIIPIIIRGQVVGWQGRFPGDLDWKATGIQKYYNLPGMPKRLMLYNIDAASQYECIVLVEGVSDVWAVGPAAVSLLGKTLTSRQIALLSESTTMIGRSKPIVLMLDPDAFHNMEGMLQQLRTSLRGCPVVIVRLPEGRDAGSYDTEYNWTLIQKAARQEGVDIKWPY